MLKVPCKQHSRTALTLPFPVFRYWPKAYTWVPWISGLPLSFSEGPTLPPCRCLRTSIADGLAFSLPLCCLSAWQFAKIFSLPALLTFSQRLIKSSQSFLRSPSLNSFFKKSFPWQHSFPGLSRLQKSWQAFMKRTHSSAVRNDAVINVKGQNL